MLIALVTTVRPVPSIQYPVSRLSTQHNEMIWSGGELANLKTEDRRDRKDRINIDVWAKSLRLARMMHPLSEEQKKKRRG